MERLKQTEAEQITQHGAWLKLRNLRELPLDHLDEDARRAEVLDFSSNEFEDLPDNLGELFPHARVLFLSDTAMRSLPAGLASCEQLEMLGMRGSRLQDIDIDALPKTLKVLTLTDNEITEIPAGIANLTVLEKFNISGNLLRDLPLELAQCQNLEMLRVASNRLVREPEMLSSLPQLKWYSDAGNVFSIPSESRALSQIEPSRIVLREEIGRSANNQVYRGLLDMQDVAVKVYGAELSTDGTVDDEIAALCTARSIKGTVGAIGTTQVDGRKAVVMPLVDKEYYQLAAPPDLAAYTRDRYREGQTFTSAQVDMVLDKVYGAMSALHNAGIAHGDVYAHNLLYSGSDVRLNDFGAASLFDGELSSVRRKIDMRAFELLAHEIQARVA